jgi:FO synthase
MMLSERLSRDEALRLAERGDLATMMSVAALRRDHMYGTIISFSPKVFIPLTRLCRNSCAYCGFRTSLDRRGRGYLSLAEALAIARKGAASGCHEALIALGDKPEIRYPRARVELAAMGYDSTIAYVADIAGAIFHETGLLPHVNPGAMTLEDLKRLRRASLSQGMMLETLAGRLSQAGGPHYRAPDKRPIERLEVVRAAGEARVPFTTGILVGIGETRVERLDALFALRDLNDAYGHIQEIIIQNFTPKPNTQMANHPPAPLEEHLWTIAIARLIFEPEMSIQAPPNLQAGHLPQLIAAGINDWGGVSPVTLDHVNPEAPWPSFDVLRKETAAAGKFLSPRLPLYPRFARSFVRWADPHMYRAVLHKTDAGGWPCADDWVAGGTATVPECDIALLSAPAVSYNKLASTIDRCAASDPPREVDIVRLFQARGTEFREVCHAADALRKTVNGDVVSYVVNRNINYTNICSVHCGFCAFSKGNTSTNLRGKPYELDEETITRQVQDAWALGATEICMQGGIHPTYTGDTYLNLMRIVRRAAPDVHIHALSPLEIHHGAETLGLSLAEYFVALKDAGLNTLPGTAAEVLNDDVRSILCPDKISVARWLDVMRTAHRQGLRSTATIMFGHIDRYEHWAQHLLHIRQLQAETGGFTEFVPLPFIHMEAPIYLKGQARRGPTFREAVLMHAVARLVLHPLIPNIQASWVKLGREGLCVCLKAGVNDMGGTLMHEAITRSAGATHGKVMTPPMFEAIAASVGRTPRQRTTEYGEPSPERIQVAQKQFSI